MLPLLLYSVSKNRVLNASIPLIDHSCPPNKNHMHLNYGCGFVGLPCAPLIVVKQTHTTS